MPAAVWVIGGLVVVVTALLTVDWFTAGRKKRRMLVRATDQSRGNSHVDYAAIENQTHGSQFDTWNP
jgi:hypothetical protein